MGLRLCQIILARYIDCSVPQSQQQTLTLHIIFLGAFTVVKQMHLCIAVGPCVFHALEASETSQVWHQPPGCDEC